MVRFCPLLTCILWLHLQHVSLLQFYPTGYPPVHIHIHTHISISESKIDLLISRVPLDSSSFISIFGSHGFRKLWPSEGIAAIVTFNIGVEATGLAELIADRLHLKARNSGIEDMKMGILSREPREPIVLVCPWRKGSQRMDVDCYIGDVGQKNRGFGISKVFQEHFSIEGVYILV